MFLLLYKYVALFVVTYLAAFVLPLPSGTMLFASGAFASQGYFNLAAVIAVAFAGNVLGDATGYAVAFRYGKVMIVRVGLGSVLRSKYYERAETYLAVFPGTLIVATRFFTQASALVNVLAGLGKMPPRVFFVRDIVGEFLYVVLYGCAGYILGVNWEANKDLITNIAAVAVSFGAFIVAFRAYRRRRKGVHK